MSRYGYFARQQGVYAAFFVLQSAGTTTMYI